MGGMWDRFRSYEIRESELFTYQRDAINQDVRRMDEILAGVMWALGRNPQQFSNILGKLWLAKTDAYPDAPRLRIWFKLDSPLVELLSIERIEEDGE
jgi:hypothetical protein